MQSLILKLLAKVVLNSGLEFFLKLRVKSFDLFDCIFDLSPLFFVLSFDLLAVMMIPVVRSDFDFNFAIVIRCVEVLEIYLWKLRISFKRLSDS